MRCIVFIVFTSISVSISFAQKKADWNNVGVLEINREKPHASMMVYDDLEKAVTDKKEISSNFKSLNGDWKFNWSKTRHNVL